MSQNHGTLVTGWRAALFCGADEVLVAAKHLVDGRAIRLQPGGFVTDIHLVFDRHEIVRAGGILSESFLSDPNDEIPQAGRYAAARPRAKSAEAALLCG